MFHVEHYPKTERPFLSSLLRANNGRYFCGRDVWRAAIEGKRKAALVLEAAPLLGAAAGLCFRFGLDLLVYIGPLEPMPWPLALLIGLALGIAIRVIAVLMAAFFISGVGWMYSGHTVIGLLIMGVHGFISIGVFATGGSAGGSPRQALAYFIASVAMAAASVLALTVATRSSRRAPSPSIETSL